MGKNYLRIITEILKNLSEENGGYSLFERLAIKCVAIKYSNWKVFPSSGSDVGGDGGRDGYCYIPYLNETRKIAASLEKSYERKINSEIKKMGMFTGMVFCSNQTIPNDKQDSIKRNYPDYKIDFLDLSEISRIVSEKTCLQRILEIPEIKESLKIDYLKDHSQLEKESSLISRYIQRKLVFQDKELENNTIDDFLNFNIDYDFCIVDSPAGYGKTEYLKYLYYNILNSDLCADCASERSLMR